MSEPSAAVRTLRFFYTTFWKPIFLVASLLLMAVGILILKWVWSETPFYVGVFVVLIAVSIAYVAVEVFGRAIGGNEGPIFPLHERRTLLFLGGYASTAPDDAPRRGKLSRRPRPARPACALRGV